MGRLSENCVLNIKNKSHSVTAEIVVPKRRADGVIIAQGGASAAGVSTPRAASQILLQPGGGQSLYVEASGPIPAGEHQVRMEFAYDGGGLGKGGKVTLFDDGNRSATAVPITQAVVFSADDGCDVGEDTGAPVSQDYGPRGNAFNGFVRGVQIAIAEAAEIWLA